MRTVVITCDRCGKKIMGYPVNIIVEQVDRESGDFQTGFDKEFSKQSESIRCRDFCEKCTGKIVRYALGGMKENEEFAKAVEEMVKNAPNEHEKEAENNTQDSRSSKEEKTGKVKIDTGK